MNNKTKPRAPTFHQRAAWDKLDSLTISNKRPPSARELMLALECNSTSTIMERLKRGVQVGRVVKIEGPFPHYVPAWWWRMVNEQTENYYGKTNQRN